jgi:hypothetical protein
MTIMTDATMLNPGESSTVQAKAPNNTRNTSIDALLGNGMADDFDWKAFQSTYEGEPFQIKLIQVALFCCVSTTSPS